MVASISFNPYATTASQGLFTTQSGGLRQGTTFPDPGLRYQRRTGVLDSTETIPMWGGVGIYENIPGVSGGPNANLGPTVGRATALTGSKKLVGFSVFDGAYGMVITPQSNVPTIGSGGQVQSFRLGSGMRIAVQCDPVLVSLVGATIRPNVSWDFVNQRLVPYETSAFTVSSGTYNNTTGVIVLTLSATAPFSVGDSLILDATAGTGNFATLDGTYNVTAVSGATVTVAGVAGNGASAITAGTATLGSGLSSALPVDVLEFQIGNSMTVDWDGTNATYNFSGNAAIIQL